MVVSARLERPGRLGAAGQSRYLVRMPPRFMSTDDLNAMIARVAPDILALLGDGVPRSEAVIVKALAGRHPKQDVKPALARLNVLGQIDLRGSRYVLAAPETEQG
jgi:hypothetical protein